ncbi:hypothetical protein AMATHDRAFT_52193 [Amanita thiersii Skay4041]|uniref:Uncharacterized protein n=1 Tax=Amanita thiersii Skay4041 TaxID=703135 RepID=A0A2A9P1E5_9AGAR|nr:hypothetical protein AMATHDRAFT_52193 [Amanita thiersii Skay4041]
MKSRDHCCCAIPLVNAGIYTTISVQFIVGLLVGILSVATPSIVGAATPSFAPWILAIFCFVGAAIQILGFIGVKREKSILYRRYVSLHGILLVGAFAVAAVWIIISATRHETAKKNCLANFFPDTSGASEGDTLCNIFPWVDIGLMSGLWAVLAVFHLYLWIVISSYGREQRMDHAKYDHLHDFHPLTADNGIPMDKRDPWDTRMSTEGVQNMSGHEGHVYGHVRQESAASASDVINEPYQYPNDVRNRDYSYQNAYPFSQPTYAYTQSSGPGLR